MGQQVGLDTCVGMVADTVYQWAMVKVVTDTEKKNVPLSRMKASGLELVASPRSLVPGMRTVHNDTVSLRIAFNLKLQWTL